MRIRYRFVPFGTDFTAVPAVRDDATPAGDVRLLHANELAVDVGGTCWDGARETRWIIDHHFQASDGVAAAPSASVAVLRLAPVLRNHFGGLNQGEHDFWLVTHRHPDFDAFCAMYLARVVIAGDVTDGLVSEVSAVIDWFRPSVASAAGDTRVCLLLAALSAHVDQGRRLACPIERAPHAVLYAALERGRHYGSETSGATELFDFMANAIRCGLNPLVDDLFSGAPDFAAELAFLEQDLVRYRRDVRKARQSVVTVPAFQQPFATSFQELVRTPLLNGAEIAPVHRLVDAPRVEFDAIWLRDPESLLVKEWARHDIESPSGTGYVFSAIAYSQGRAGAPYNETDYFFSLDPERSGRAHLYAAWAALQQAELEALTRLEPVARQSLVQPDATPRPGFEGRAGTLGMFFDDPWFDGNNYACTIVATPNRGSVLSPGVRPDLTDDMVARVVQRELEWNRFDWRRARARDEPTGDRGLTPQGLVSGEFPISLEEFERGTVRPPAPGSLRAVTLPLVAGVRVDDPRLTVLIAKVLWKLLMAGDNDRLPADFESRHVIADTSMVVVWSRQGIAIAHEAQAGFAATAVLAQFDQLTRLARDVSGAVEGRSLDPERGEQLLREAAVFKHRLAAPEGRHLRRLFEARAFDDALTSLVELVNRARTRALEKETAAQTKSIDTNITTVAEVQTKLEWIELLIIAFYVAELTHTFLAASLPSADHASAEAGWHIMLIALASLVAGGLAYWYIVRPEAGKGEVPRHVSRRLLVVPIILLLYLAAWAGFGMMQIKSAAHETAPVSRPPSSE